MNLRPAIRHLAALVGCFALVSVLYNQFAGTVPDRPWLLAAAVLVWWFTGDPSSGQTRAPRRVLRPGRGRVLAAWTACGLALSGATAYYVQAGLNRERIDPVLACCGVVLIVAARFRTARWRGPEPVGTRGRTRGLLAATAVALAGVLLALFGRFVGLGLAQLAFWVPTHTRAFLDERAGWAAVPGTWLAWLVWAFVVGALTGVLQSYEVRRQRIIRSTTSRVAQSRRVLEPPRGGLGSGYRPRIHTEVDERTDEDIEDRLLSMPLPRTGLVPVLQWQFERGGWSSTTSSRGSFHSQTAVTRADGTWRVRSVQIPPAYLPGWVTFLLRALRARGNTDVS